MGRSLERCFSQRMAKLRNLHSDPIGRVPFIPAILRTRLQAWGRQGPERVEPKARISARQESVGSWDFPGLVGTIREFRAMTELRPYSRYWRPRHRDLCGCLDWSCWAANGKGMAVGPKPIKAAVRLEATNPLTRGVGRRTRCGPHQGLSVGRRASEPSRRSLSGHLTLKVALP